MLTSGNVSYTSSTWFILEPIVLRKRRILKQSKTEVSQIIAKTRESEPFVLSSVSYIHPWFVFLNHSGLVLN